MKNTMRKGFTLIELLVVITIIGILATGAISVYTSQIQKARDTTRINDIKALQSGVEQFYQDTSEYPTGDDFGTGGTNSSGESVTGVKSYVPKIPKDPKSTKNCNDNGTGTNPICDYIYFVSTDKNGIDLGSYEISTAFENQGNITGKAAKDGGSPDRGLLRYETGLRTDTLVTDYDTSTNGDPAVDGDKFLVIKGAAYKQ